MKIKALCLIPFMLSSAFSQTLGFEEALDLLQDSTPVQTKKLELQKTQSYLKEITAKRYGKLSFQETYLHTDHAGYAFNSKLSSRRATFKDFGLGSYTGPASLNVEPRDLNYPEAVENFESKLIYELPLFTGFELSNAKDIAKLQILAKQAQTAYDIKVLSLELLNAYNATVTAKVHIKAIKASKKASARALSYATALYEEGMVTHIDVKQARVHDLKMQSKLLEANKRFKLALAYLGFLIKKDNLSDVQTLHMPKLQDIKLLTLQEQALKQREDLKAMKLQTQISNKKINIEHSNYYPKLNSYVEYGFNRDQFDEFAREDDYYLASVGLELKLFDQTRAQKLEQAKIDHAKAKLEYEQHLDAIKLQIKQNLLNFKHQQQIVKEKLLSYELAKAILVQSEEMYKNNLIKMNELLKEQSLMLQAHAQMIMANYELSLYAAQLKLSISDSLKDKHD